MRNIVISQNVQSIELYSQILAYGWIVTLKSLLTKHILLVLSLAFFALTLSSLNDRSNNSNSHQANASINTQSFSTTNKPGQTATQIQTSNNKIKLAAQKHDK